MSDLHSSLVQLADLAEKRDEVRFAFMRHILILASGLIGILVSLHKISSDNHLRIAFCVCIVSLALGIILLAISLSAQVRLHKVMFQKWKEEVRKKLNDENYLAHIITYEPGKFYGYFEVVAYISFIIAIVSMSAYALLIA